MNIARLTIAVFDYLISFAVIILLSPLFLIISMAIIIESGLPIFYKHNRVSKNKYIFELYKFRSMVKEADQLGPPLTVKNDNRVTSVGKFLRKHKLDELPNFLNVLSGDMSIVGPRPEAMKYIKHIDPKDLDILLSVKPGVTSIASVNFKNEENYLDQSFDISEYNYINKILPEKIKFEVDYIKTNSKSILKYFSIILKTIYK